MIVTAVAAIGSIGKTEITKKGPRYAESIMETTTDNLPPREPSESDKDYWNRVLCLCGLPIESKIIRVHADKKNRKSGDRFLIFSVGDGDTLEYVAGRERDLSLFDKLAKLGWFRGCSDRYAWHPRHASLKRKFYSRPCACSHARRYHHGATGLAHCLICECSHFAARK